MEQARSDVRTRRPPPAGEVNVWLPALAMASRRDIREAKWRDGVLCERWIMRVKS